jgi:DNA-binding transcriptional regulator PaaX
MKIGISPDIWQNKYTSVFQGMREDKPQSAVAINKKFCNVFKLKNSLIIGKYILTDYGKNLIKEENNKIYGKVKIFNKEYTILIHEADDSNEEEIREQLKEDIPCFSLYTDEVLQVFIN